MPQRLFSHMIITAQDLYNYSKCAHRVYLDAHGDPSERAKANAFVRLLWEMGLQTEREYIRGLGEGDYANLQALPVAQACKRTLELMVTGAGLIFQGAIRAGNWVGRPDLLIKRTDARSQLGDYYYEPIEIKAGRGWEERDGKRTGFKPHYAFQILFYRKILQQLQEHLPSVGHIINVDMQMEEFETGAFESTFEQALAEVERLVAGAETSEPVLGSACHLCHWYPRCRRWVEGTGDPSGLYFVGKQKFDLKRVGLDNIREIAVMDVGQYLRPPNKIPRMGEKALVRMKTRAQVKLAGRPQIRAGYAFPQHQREIYFDIEDDPTRDLTYLFGLVSRDANARGDFHYFIARSPQQEEDIVRAFWEFVRAAGNAVFYVYSAKERATLKRLMQRYRLDETVYDRYLEREYDLYSDLVVKYSDWPTYSYGIKQIAGLVGFKWRDPDPSGANSIVWYNDYLNSGSPQLLERILDYNEDDCRAMMAVKDHFASHSLASAAVPTAG